MIDQPCWKQKKSKSHRVEIYFVNSRMKMYPGPLVDGLEVDGFLRRNADDAYLMAEGHWDILHEREVERNRTQPSLDRDGSLPF